MYVIVTQESSDSKECCGNGRPLGFELTGVCSLELYDALLKPRTLKADLTSPSVF